MKKVSNFTKTACLVALTLPLSGLANPDLPEVKICANKLDQIVRGEESAVSKEQALSCIEVFKSLSDEDLNLEIHDENWDEGDGSMYAGTGPIYRWRAN